MCGCVGVQVRLLENFARVLLKRKAEEPGANPLLDNLLKNMPNVAAMAERAAQVM